MTFLDEAEERHGREIVTQLGDDGQGRTLTTEARMIKDVHQAQGHRHTA